MIRPTNAATVTLAEQSHSSVLDPATELSSQPLAFPCPQGRKFPHAALSYLLAAVFAFAAFSLGYSPKIPSAPDTPRASIASGMDLHGEAAARFCLLLLDNADRNLLETPKVVVIPAEGPLPSDASRRAVEFLTTSQFLGRLQRETRRLLDDPNTDVTLTQHVQFHGASCYSFEITPSPVSRSPSLLLLFDQRTCQPLGCRFLPSADGSATDVAATCEWLVAPKVADRDEAVQR